MLSSGLIVVMGMHSPCVGEVMDLVFVGYILQSSLY